ncbi:hypothetical protein ACHAP5_006578 [Fusarium lateritium]
MNNDLTWLNENKSISESDLPRIIWYPETALKSTYRELAYLVPEMKQLAAQALIVCESYHDFMMLKPKATFDLWEEMNNRKHPGKFQDFFDEHMTEEGECKWAEWIEFPPDVEEIAPYDHLVSKEMKSLAVKVRKELTLDNVGFENREVFHIDKLDAREVMRYLSAFPKEPRDHLQEKRERHEREMEMK